MKKNEQSREMTANEFTNVKNIRDCFLYTKDNLLMCYLRIYPYNLDLLSQEEKRGKTNIMAASFDGDRKDFVYFTLPREIDLENYTDDIKKLYNEEMVDLGCRRILKNILQEAVELSTSGENYEHQHFIKIWKQMIGDKNDVENEIRARIEEFQGRFEAVGMNARILKSGDILKMCNLYANAAQAPFANQSSLQYEPLTKI